MTGIYFLLKNFNSKFYQQLLEKKKLLRNSRLLMNVGKVQRITIRSDYCYYYKFYWCSVCHYKIVSVCIPASHYFMKSCTKTKEIPPCVVIKISRDDITCLLPSATKRRISMRFFFWVFPSGVGSCGLTLDVSL